MLTALLGNHQKILREGRRYGRAFFRRSLEKTAQGLGSEAKALGSRAITIPDDDGYVKLSAAELAGGDASFAKISELCRTWINDASRVNKEKKEFLINLMRGQDLIDHPEILKLALHDEILSAVTRYFDQAPRLFNLYMWWSPPNQSLKGSQLYHYDHRDTRQAKVFINLNDVTDESGPLHFIKASDCLKVDAGIGYSQDRYTDEEVYSCMPESNVVVAKGKAGTAFIVDTARCLHYGSRGNSLDRLILMVSFARANAVEPGNGCETLDPVRDRLVKDHFADDPVRSFILTAPR
jgi:hypothetical protein